MVNGWPLRGVGAVACALAMVWACSSGSSKKKVPTPFSGEAGAAGSAGESSAGAADNGGNAGSAPSGGSAGELPAADAGAGGTAGEAGAAPAGGSGGGTVNPFHGLYVSTTGLDTNGGSHEAPFLTLAHALSVAVPGDTVVLLDGSYAAQVAVTVPDGVNVMAEHSGLAKLGCQLGSLFTFKGSSKLDGLELDNCAQPVVAITSGKLDMVNLLIVNGGTTTGAIHVGGTVLATLTGDADHVYTQSGRDVLFADGSASITVTGGTFKNVNTEGFSGNGMLRTAGSAKLLVKDVTIVDVQQTALSGAGTSEITVDHTTMDTLSQNVILMRDTAKLTVMNQSRLAIKPLAPSHFEVLRSEGTGSISLSDTELTGGSAGINGSLPALTLSNCKIHDNDGLGIDMANATVASATVTITNTELSNNGSLGTQIHGAMRLTATLLNVKFRGVTIKTNGGAFADYGVNVSGGLGSSYDFGTLADPGLNTFLVNSAAPNGNGGAALTIQGPAGVSIPAVGNTWTPSLQGAGADGKYFTPGGTVKVLELTGPQGTGQTGVKNYVLATTSVIRLAQDP